jgi:hypothetical protein
VLFLSFRGLVEDLDHDVAIDQFGTQGLRRRRRSSAASSKSEFLGMPPPKAKGVSEDLRALLDNSQGTYTRAVVDEVVVSKPRDIISSASIWMGNGQMQFL